MDKEKSNTNSTDNTDNIDNIDSTTQVSQATPEKDVISSVSSSTGTMLEKYDLDKLVSMSDIIAIGKVTDSVNSRWNTKNGDKPLGEEGYIIYTDTNIKIEEYLKGSYNEPTITVRVQGGAVGQDTQYVEDQPYYMANERVLIFLKNDDDIRTKDIGDKHFITTGSGQGKISVSQNNDIVIDGEKMSINDIKVRITGKK